MPDTQHSSQSTSQQATVYRDEPLRFSATQARNFTPPRYRRMREIAKEYGLYYEYDERVFYEQGKFMEDFEDDFDFRGEFVKYFPTYQSMTDAQLRGYFSWRTKVRRGTVERTSLSFAFVYIYELLNQIGVRSPLEGFRTLKNFWMQYKEIDFKIDPYVKLWLKDYVVYNNLYKSLLDDFSDAHFDGDVLVLLDHASYGTEELFSAINSLSHYNLKNSRFFKLHPEDVENVVCNVFRSLSDHDTKKRKCDPHEKFFGKIYATPYRMFKSAVFYDRQKDQKNNAFTYKINDVYKYTLADGRWSCERFFCYGGKNQQIGSLLRTVDFLMRQKYRFKSPLKPGATSKAFQKIIDQEIDRYLERQKELAMPKIEIDVSKLQDIRETSLETQGKLIVEDPEDTNVPEIAESTPGNDTGLSDAESQFIKCLLYGKPTDELLRSNGLMLSLLVDSINENLFDRFGDTVIVWDGEAPELVADYIDTLKGLFAE